ncbi:MAG: acyltransferase [Hyphomicrobiaceae bacterium]
MSGEGAAVSPRRSVDGSGAGGRRGNLPAVQVMRLIAASMVVVYHAEVQVRRLSPDATLDLGIGAAGVDLFFVISGFIMVYVTSMKPQSGSEFLLNRLARIAPLYWLYMTAMVAGLAIAPALFKSSAFDPPHLVLSYLFVPFPHPVLGIERPFLPLGWTLNYEMFFYAVFAALMWMPLGRRVTAMAGGFAMLAAIGWMFPGLPSPVSFYASGMLLEFVFGMVIGIAFVRHVPSSLAAIAGAMVVASALVAVGVLSGVSEGPERVIYWGIPAAVVIATVLHLEREGLWPRMPVVELLGDASYSIYLSHIFVLPVAAGLLTRFGVLDLLGATALRAMLLVIAVAAGTLAYLVIERPVIRSSTRLLKSVQGPRRGTAGTPERMLRPATRA